jgi:hypothetical protein
MGRNEPGGYGNQWTPPTYTVDGDGKVVGGYAPREPNNWGRWGPDDQRGTQNLIGPQERVAAAGSSAPARCSRWRSRSRPTRRASPAGRGR